MIYGPYDRSLPFAPLRAWFLMKVDNNWANNDDIVSLDIYDADLRVVVASRKVRRRDFSSSNQHQWFHLDFDWRGHNGNALETRVYTHGNSYINVNSILIRDGF